ncbi:MAG: NUDIX hydrolase [Candidatus Doudnabacteria bacterium]|nr:NUDIX hydrolase [Candidatus Doudnabacteria bacterium]
MIYEYCSKCGHKYDKTDTEMFICSKCKHIVYLNSKPTASTLIIDDDRILLGKRRNEPEKGKWDVIGGFLEYGEHPEDGAKREAKEETGLNVKIEKFLGIFMDEYGPDKISILNVGYIVTIADGEPVAGDDIEELQWFNYNELPTDIAFKNGREMLKAWIKQL